MQQGAQLFGGAGGGGMNFMNMTALMGGGGGVGGAGIGGGGNNAMALPAFAPVGGSSSAPASVMTGTVTPRGNDGASMAGSMAESSMAASMN